MRQHNQLGQFLKEQRQRLRMTQAELTKRIGLGATVSISRWEHGIDPIPPRHYRTLSAALDLSIDSILAMAQKDHPEHVEEYRRLTKQLGYDVPVKVDPGIGVWNIRRDLRDGLKALTRTYPRASEIELLEAAVEYFLDSAKRTGLDGHWHPIAQVPTEQSSPSYSRPSAGSPEVPAGLPRRRINRH